MMLEPSLSSTAASFLVMRNMLFRRCAHDVNKTKRLCIVHMIIFI